VEAIISITRQDIEDALSGHARIRFDGDPKAILPNGQETYAGTVAYAIGKLRAGLGPWTYEHPDIVAAFNYIARIQGEMKSARRKATTSAIAA
jgi:hypothetical protein